MLVNYIRPSQSKFIKTLNHLQTQNLLSLPSTSPNQSYSIFNNTRMKVFEGLPSRNKNILYLSIGYTTLVGLYAWSVSCEQSSKAKHEFIEFYRHAGHYKHPWAKEATPVPEHVRATDYTKLIENPQGIRYFQSGYRV